jgi:hypothetical protein
MHDILTDEAGRKYVDLTPTWSAILPTWRFAVEQVTTRDKSKNGSNPDLVMTNFWEQMRQMASAADKWNEHCKESHNDLP